MTERNYWQRMRRNRVSRRALLRASGRAGVGAAGLALVGCGDDDDDSGAVSRAAQQEQQQQQAAERQTQSGQQQQSAQQQAQEQQQQAAADQAEQADQQEATADEQAADQQQAAAVSNIIRGGALRFSGPMDMDYFDPHRGVFGPVQYWMGLYMNYLVRWRNKEKGIMEADVASLPEIPDDETYIFQLDRGASFWDRYPTEGGRLVTSQDIVDNFQRQIDAVDATGAEDGTFLGADAFRKTASMDTPDETTFIAKTDGADATYLGAILRPFSWITSPEAMAEFGDRWRDEAQNVELSSGTGAYIPVDYDPDIAINMVANPNYWKPGADGGMLPYPDGFRMDRITDPTAVETAYRSNELMYGDWPLTALQVDEISKDFPEHPTAEVAFGYTIITNWANFNPDWPGEDGLGNPWLDRRFAYAFHVALDRYLMIDAVYLGSAKISANEMCPWFNTAWGIPQDELITFPGYRPDRDLDVALARELIDATGYDKDRTLTIIAPDLWESTSAGILETEKTMYEEALGIPIHWDVQPYTVILQRLQDGTYPGSGPQWTNPPSDLDPTGDWVRQLLPGGSTNLWHYEYEPVSEIVQEMQVTLDTEERKTMAREIQQIGMGVDPDHGLDGIFASFGVMNAVQRSVWWPYMHRPDDTIQFAHASHLFDEAWLDTTHEDYPA